VWDRSPVNNSMKGEFVILRNGELETYSEYDDIPHDFEHVIKFAPEYPSEPHTEEEHAQMATFNDKLQQLMEIERASSN